MTNTEKQQLLFTCGKVFSPATPISTRDLFAGRTDQIMLVGQAVHTRGQHAIIFGERGVGKTSLANVLTVLLSEETTIVVKINCTNEDNFHKLWRNVLSQIEIVTEEEGIGFHPSKKVNLTTAAEGIDDEIGPEDIRRLLTPIGKRANVVVIFDEFDRLQGARIQRMFADTIKNFSDHELNTTLVIVGVANDVSGLIKEHASVDRSLVQIPMPRMQISELKEIITKAMKELGMTIANDAMDLLVMLSLGLPYYTHLLGNEATISAINCGKKKIDIVEAKRGVHDAMSKIQYSILESVPKALCCGPSPWSLVPKPIPVLRPGQPTEHQLNHADPDLRLAGISQVFIILAVNPAPTQPAEGSLHHPPPRQQLKPSVPAKPADDLNHIPPVLRDPSVQGVIVVLGVRPQLSQARERFSRQLAEDLRCRRRIIHGRTGVGHG